MKMNKLFTGLVAFVAGFALSAGSALATKGYLAGDSAMMKVIPHFEVGYGKATIIGIANLESGDANMDECYEIDGTTGAISTTLDADNCPFAVADGTDDAEDDINANDPNHEAMANARANADDPMNLIITMMIHDAAGASAGSVQLCLEENQFGYVVLHDGMLDVAEMPHRGVAVSMMDHPRGYATIAGVARINECAMGYVTPDEEVMGPDATMPDDVMPAMAAWTIIQDVSENGFFGTEVPTSTLSMMENDDMEMVLDCYGLDVDGDGTIEAAEGAADEATLFNMHKCGLIPERHNNARLPENDDTSVSEALNANPVTATPRAHVTARYDVGADSRVYVWLGSAPRAPLEISVICEEGLPTAIDDPSSNVPTTELPTAEIAVSMGTTVIDPSAGEVGTFTEMCMYDRGVLSFRMPDGSGAGMVWTHVTQDMNHFRMNFPGYSMANPHFCNRVAGADDSTGDDVCM